MLRPRVPCTAGAIAFAEFAGPLHVVVAYLPGARRLATPRPPPDAVTLTVLLFASYADAIGRPSLELELDAGATVGDVVERLKRDAGRALPPRPLVAVNHEYADYARVLVRGDEVAVIPPVAGG